MRQTFSVFMILSLVFITSNDVAQAKNYNTRNKSSSSSTNADNPKYASLVMDAESGMILSQRYADKILHPASLTKMMTMLLTFEALDAGVVRKNTPVRISKHAASMVPSKLGLKVGETIQIEHAIKALATKSANDVAVALAEHLGNTESRFATSMTARARSIGMKQTRFKNASGLHNKHQVSTARDMAKLARYILKRYPHHYKYFSTRNFTYRGKTYGNHNKLLENYRGADGFKTGYINASGFNLVASAHRNGRRLIGVVFGGRSGKTRNAHMEDLLDAGFKRAKNPRTARNNLSTPPKPIAKPTYGVAQVSPQTKTVTALQNNTENHASLAPLNNKQTTRITAKLPNPPKPKPANAITPNYSALNNGTYATIIGEGDIDPSASKRLETGLIAMAMHQGNSTAKTIHSIPHPKDIVGKWAVQIGAFTSRIKTDDALRNAKTALPAHLKHASAMTVPLNTKNGLVFRARLGSMNESQARSACQYFKNCITISPIATQLSAK